MKKGKKSYCVPSVDIVRFACVQNTCDDVFNPLDPNNLNTGSPYYGNN